MSHAFCLFRHEHKGSPILSKTNKFTACLRTIQFTIFRYTTMTSTHSFWHNIAKKLASYYQRADITVGQSVFAATILYLQILVFRRGAVKLLFLSCSEQFPRYCARGFGVRHRPFITILRQSHLDSRHTKTAIFEVIAAR